MTEKMFRLRSLRVIALGAAFFVPLASTGCSHTPEEPTNQRSSAGPTVSPLKFTAPSGWSRTETSETSPRRAVYKVPHVGDDKEDAEVVVLFFGTGTPGDRDKTWDEWFGQFDGDPKKDAKRTSFDVKGMQVEQFEFLGTYKLNMGPHRAGMTKSPVQMVKTNNRMIADVVHTKDRGNWFFRIVGPDATVQSAAADYRSMLDSAE